MCGIAGVLRQKESKHQTLSSLNKMINCLEHRGPDSNGSLYDENSKIALGHTRLSIIDLNESGAQPMVSECKNYTIVFNGEIYNFKEIKELIEKTYGFNSWKGTSDTEILVECISHFGFKKTLELARGMFAFGVHDKKNNKLFLARDRFGEKPIYFHLSKDHKKLVFASELKAIINSQLIKKNLCNYSVNHYFSYGYTPSSNSIYQDISKVRPGRYLEIDLLSFDFKDIAYFQNEPVAINQSEFHLSDNNVINKAEELIRKSVEQQMRADVPVGVFLSGGIDSSLIASVMSEMTDLNVESFSVGSSVAEYDESKHASIVSKAIGTNHNEIIVKPDDLLEEFIGITKTYDEPFSDSSQFVTKLVSNFARKKVKVALTGDGADEIFGGYNRHLVVARYWDIIAKIPFELRKFLAHISNRYGTNTIVNFLRLIGKDKDVENIDLKIQKIIQILKSNNIQTFYETLTRTWQMDEQISLLSGYEKSSNLKHLNLKYSSNIKSLMDWDLNNYMAEDILTKVDRAAMSVSLETRAPYLDKELVEFSFSLPDHFHVRNDDGWETKWILRQLLYKRIPKNIVNRPKMGFGFPLGAWLKGPLREWCQELMVEDDIRGLGVINYDIYIKKWNEHISGKRNWQYQIWNAVILHKWMISNGVKVED